MGTVIAIGVVVVVLTGAFLTLALALRSETRRAGDEKAARTNAEAERDAAKVNAKNESARADFQKGRADALDAAIVRHAAGRPVDGSFELLEARERANAGAAGDRGADELHHAGAGEAAPEAVDPDRLLPPGS